MREVAIVGSMGVRRWLASGAAVIAMAPACSKEEAADVSPAAAVAAPEDSLPEAAAPAPADVASAVAPAPAPSASVDPCGPSECPLRGWMREHSAAAMSAKNFAALAAVFDRIAAFAPDGGYPYWAWIAKDGEDAAHVEDLDATRAACRGCHTQYRSKYKREMRARPL
jgi:hypothetical protein